MICCPYDGSCEWELEKRLVRLCAGDGGSGRLGEKGLVNVGEVSQR
jgi:hypothetical protein